MRTKINVAIDARYWRSSIQTGVERYIHLLLEALSTIDVDTIQIALVMLDSEASAPIVKIWARPNVKVIRVRDRSDRTLLRALDSYNPSVVHYPFELPRQLSHPSVFTLHDAGRYLFPHLMVRKVRECQNERLRSLLTDPLLRAVITVSEASRVDISGFFGNSISTLVVVPNFVSRPLLARLRAHAKKHQERSEGFLLGVGVYMPTKNIPRLCRAFHLARQMDTQNVPPRLLLTGRRGWERALPTKRADNIEVLGHVDDTKLVELYSTASGFVFPSLYEGFGMPAQEALAAGQRVLCSDIPVFREITSGLAVFADSSCDKTLAEGIVTLCQSRPPNRSKVLALMERFGPKAAGEPLLQTYRMASEAS